MRTVPEIENLHRDLAVREELLRVNNASARETSHLAKERFDHLINLARVATYIPPSAAFLLAFEQSDNYDGGHFQWFRDRFDRFLYIDRVVVAEGYRRHGLGRALYADLFRRARELSHATIACEVNLLPPNPVSDQFHATHGFMEVGQATFDAGAKMVRYLLRRDDGAPIASPHAHSIGRGRRL